MRYFYNEENGHVVHLGEGNRLTILTPLFITDADEKEFASARHHKVVSPEKGTPKEKKEERRGKGLRHCKACGKAGHRSDHCPDGQEEVADEGMETPPDVAKKMPALTPAKLTQIKNMLGKGEPVAFIATEVGVSEERIDQIAQSLGL